MAALFGTFSLWVDRVTGNVLLLIAQFLVYAASMLGVKGLIDDLATILKFMQKK